MRTIKLPTGAEIPIANNKIPYHLNCPIDGTQLAENTEQDSTYYHCVTCHAPYSVRGGRITKEILNEQARHYIINSKIRLAELENETGRLEKIIGLAKMNGISF